MKKLIMTLDIDAYFAQAEQIRKPSLKNKAIAIGHKLNNKGIISTSTYEARKKGVYSGMPFYKAKRICPNIIMVEPDYEYYVKLSENVFQIVSSMVDKIEVGSIDEVHFEVTSKLKFKKPLEIAQEIQQVIFRKTKLTTSIGISTNTLLSKIASNLKKPFGITTLFSYEIKTKLWPLDIIKIPYIGKQTSNIYKKYKINTIGELANINKESDLYYKLYKMIGINLDKQIQYANGKGTDEIYNSKYKSQSISLSKTFPINLTSYEEIRHKLFNMINLISNKAKYRNLVGKVVGLETKDNGAKKSSQNRQITLVESTNDVEILWNELSKLIDDWWSEDKIVSFLGISLSLLEDGFYKKTQITLENLKEIEKKEKKEEYELIKKLNHIIGYEALASGKAYIEVKKFKDNSLLKDDKVKFKKWKD